MRRLGCSHHDRRHHTARPAPALPAARRRGARGGARDQRRPDRRTRCRGRDADPDALSTAGSRTRTRPTGTTCRSGCRGASARSRSATTSCPTTPASASAPTSSTSASSTRPGKGLGNAAGFRGWSGGARRHFRLSHHWATPGYLAGPITPGPLARHPRPVPDHAARYAVARHGHPRARRADRAGVPGAPGARRRTRHRGRLVPRRPAHAQRPLRRSLDAGPARRPGAGQRAGLPRHLRPQHQRGHARLRHASSPTTSSSSAARR